MICAIDTAVTEVRFVGPVYSQKLEKLGIQTVYDLLTHVPTRYEDYSLIVSIASLQPGEVVTVQGKITRFENAYSKNGKIVQKGLVTDETGTLALIWFNQPYLSRVLPVGQTVSLSGKVDWFGAHVAMISPEFELMKSSFHPPAGGPASRFQTIHTGRLVPVYAETAGVSSKWLRSRINPLLGQYKQQLIEYLPNFITTTFNLMPFEQAVAAIHFPKNPEEAVASRARLAFDELFFIQLASYIRKRQWTKEVVGHRLDIAQYRNQITAFWEKLPFELTSAQKKAVSEIFADLSKESPMNRLLEGDVGSGKTVVSAIALYVSYLNGYQGAFMAPTEILAQQHYATISQLLEPFGVHVDLRTGSTKKNQESRSKNQGKSDIIIGTHALLSANLPFENLGLVVIDEQHRFGVEQRATLRQKGINPHILTMTATPIPRTVALTLYGELDLSYLDELPKGRKHIRTWVVPAQKRDAAYTWIAKEIKAGNQAFIVCPFIEESETQTTVKAATGEFDHLSKIVFPKLRLGLLHGKLSGKAKEAVLSDFRKGACHILVSTPVVEVGIDIPGATIMMIEGADRFGLSQLHQLRGRVGRGDRQSYCLLFTESTAPEVTARLKYLEQTTIGSQLAELDLKLRGAGDLYGTRQHGIVNLKIASLSDRTTIEKSKQAVELVVKQDQTLSQFPILQQKLQAYTMKKSAPD